METLTTQSKAIKRHQGQRMVNEERFKLIFGIVELLEQGYVSNLSIAKQLGVDGKTVGAYRGIAENIAGHYRTDKTYLRNKLIMQTEHNIERLTIALERVHTTSEIVSLYNAIIKYYHFMSLITGITSHTLEQDEIKPMVIVRPFRTT